MNQNDLGLSLSLDDVNKIMTALGNMPYIQVFQVINKIQKQVSEQMQEQLSAEQISVPGNGKEN
jgi:hypothetical protein